MHKAITYITAIFLLIGDLAYGQMITFRRTVGNLGEDFGNCVRETSDHGFVVVGSTGSVDNTNSQIYLFKLDSVGNLKWSKNIGTGFGTERGSKLVETPDNGFIIVGTTNSIGNGGYDAYAVKTDANGNVVWENSYGGIDWDFATDIVALNSGNYLVVGNTFSYGNGNSDIYLIEITPNGDEVWSKTVGTEGEEIAKAAVLSNDGHLLICGSQYQVSSEYSDGYVVKTDLTGDTLWTKTFGADSTEVFADLVELIGGDFMAVGNTLSFDYENKKSQIYMVRFNNSGDMVWEKTEGGHGDEEINEIEQNPAGIIALIGYTTSAGFGNTEMMLFQVNSSGFWVDSPDYGSIDKENGYSVHNTHDNGYILAGITNGFDIKNYDVYIIKTDSTGHTESTTDITHITDNLVSTEEHLLDEESCLVYTTGSQLKVLSQKNGIEGLTVYNISGQAVSSQSISHTTQQLETDISGFSYGIYFVRVDFEDGKFGVKKILLNP